MTPPMTLDGLNLKDLVAATVRDVVGELVTGSVRESLADAAPAAAITEAGRSRVESVRISSDADLDVFARRLLSLFENPKTRQDLRSGRLRFQLAALSQAAAPASVAPPHRVDKGAVTERQVRAAAEAGQRIVLGPRAVLTPLGREKARALGVHIEKER